MCFVGVSAVFAGACTGTEYIEKEVVRIETKAVEKLHIKPLFTVKSSRYYDAWLNELQGTVFNKILPYNAADFRFFTHAQIYILQTELYLIANQHLDSLPEAEKQAFYDSYQEWLADYQKKCREPHFDENGIPYEGTITLDMDVSREYSLLKDYLKTFKEYHPAGHGGSGK